MFCVFFVCLPFFAPPGPAVPDGQGGFVPFTNSRVMADGELRPYVPAVDGIPPVPVPGGVLLCNEYGCRSSPYFPPVPVPTRPPAVYVPPSPGRDAPPPTSYEPPLHGYQPPPVRRGRPPQGFEPPPPDPPEHHRSARPPKPAAKAPCYDGNGQPVEPTPPDCRTPAPPDRAGRSAAEEKPPQSDSEGMQVQQDILQFCREHRDEQFCHRLEDWLAKHPESMH
jgi:hypothetical protein